jgi:hypothetical protein
MNGQLTAIDATAPARLVKSGAVTSTECAEAAIEPIDRASEGSASNAGVSA